MTAPALAAAVADTPQAIIPLYGVLPWRMTRKTGLRILLISGENGDGWTIPAGPPVEGRAGFMSAALHAFEEAGVIGEIGTAPQGEYRCRPAGADDAPERRIRLYAMEVQGTLSHWKQHGKRRRRWFPAHDAAALPGDAALAGMVRDFASSRPESGLRAGSRS